MFFLLQKTDNIQQERALHRNKKTFSLLSISLIASLFNSETGQKELLRNFKTRSLAKANKNSKFDYHELGGRF